MKTKVENINDIELTIELVIEKMKTIVVDNSNNKDIQIKQQADLNRYAKTLLALYKTLSIANGDR